MLSDLSIRAVSPITGPSENPAEPKPATVTPPANVAPPQTGPPILNPSLRLDPALGLVVIEFRDESGHITTAIPSQRQIDAYRMWSEPLPGGDAHPTHSHSRTPARRNA